MLSFVEVKSIGFIFLIVVEIKYIIPECTLLANDIVFVDDTREGVSAKLEVWSEVL